MSKCPNCLKEMDPGQAICPTCAGKVATPAAKTSKLAVVSAIIGFLGLFPLFVPLALLAVVGGIISAIRVPRSRGSMKGKGFAVAAIVLGFFGITFAFLYLPGFFKMMAKSRQTEAKTYLGAIYTAQERYYAEYGVYASTFEALDWRPEQMPKYSYYLADDLIPAMYQTAEPLPPEIKTFAGKDGFLAAAVADSSLVDTDPTIDVWTIDHRKNLQCVINDAND